MTRAIETGSVPQWTVGDRLRKAREWADLGVGDLANAIGVTRKTVSDAEHGKRRVRPITLNAWSLATGVSRQWLTDGTIPPDGPLAQLAELRTFNPKFDVKNDRFPRGPADLEMAA